MVEINNQRKAFLDMLAWSEWTDNGRRNQKSWLWRHCRRRAYLLITPITSQTCHAKPKTQINRRRTLPASFLLVGCLPQSSLAWKTSLRKVRTLWHCSRLRSVALYLWLIVVISVRQSTVAAISGLHCRALVMVSSEHKAGQPDCKIQRSGRNGQRDWCMSRVTAIISALVICIIVCLSWVVNHYRDNAITYKAQRDKNARELKLANAAITGHADASAWCCCARCKIHEGVSDAKAENDALRDDVAAGRRRLDVSLSVSAWSHHASGVIMQPPPDWQTPLNGDYFLTSERLITMQKRSEGT